MKPLEEIQSFIENYLEDSYQLELNQFDNSVTEQDHYWNAQEYLDKYFAAHYEMIKSGGISNKNANLSEDELEERNSIKKPELYVIRTFENARFGKGIKTNNKNLYTCIIGGNSIWLPKGMYSQNIGIGELNSELKIVSIRTPIIPVEYNDSELISWKYGDRSVEKRDGYAVLDEGIMIDSASINSPSEQYLKDFEIKL